MSKICPSSIIISAIFLAFASTADAVTITLQNSTTQKSNVETNLREAFEVNLFVDPESESLVGVSIYLSVDDQFLELIDANPTADGLQPIKIEQLIPPTWQEFDKDTRGDPGNVLVGFQIDYVRLSIVADDVVHDAGVVGRMCFRPIRAMASTTISIDSDPSASRLTEATIVTVDGRQQ